MTTKNSLSFSDLTESQQRAIDRLYDHDHTLLIAKKGFGKACISQTAAQELLNAGILSRVLVIAPPRVAQLTWATEFLKWEHLEEVGMATGDPDQRLEVLTGEHRIVVVSADNLRSVFDVVREYGLTFDGLILDEVSRMKSVGGKNFRALRPHIKNFKWRVGLSATPVAEAGQDLYGQMLVVDNGKSLGRSKDAFMRAYFVPDWNGYNWEPQHGAAARIAEAVKDVVWMAEDTGYEASLPPLIERVVEVELPPKGWAAYEELAETMYLEAQDVEAVNAAVLAGKLMQAAAGFVYGEDGEVHRLHYRKMHECVGQVEAIDGPVVVVYQFIEELRYLKGIYPDALVLAENPAGAMKAWNAGECDVLLIHPKSAAHGINLQYGGCHLICISPIWSADAWSQVVGRLWRRGQQNPVTRTVIVAKGTIDRAILRKLTEKESAESLLMSHLREMTG
jgi:hypothetical protein